MKKAFPFDLYRGKRLFNVGKKFKTIKPNKNIKQKIKSLKKKNKK